MLKPIVKYEQGIGLLEVLISLLILAVAVLGFSALQMRVAKATDESLSRSDAMMAIRNISESMRLYPEHKVDYMTAINSENVSSNNCIASACTREEEVKSLAYQAKQIATANDLSLSAVECPLPTASTSDLVKVCLIASWGDTTADMNGTQATSPSASRSCANANGSYIPGATCFIMETY